MKPIKRRIARLEAKVPTPEVIFKVRHTIIEPDGKGGRREVGQIDRQPDGRLGPLISTANKGDDES